MSNAIPTRQELVEAKQDLDDLEEIINGGSTVTVSTRLGGNKPRNTGIGAWSARYWQMPRPTCKARSTPRKPSTGQGSHRHR